MGEKTEIMLYTQFYFWPCEIITLYNFGVRSLSKALSSFLQAFSFAFAQLVNGPPAEMVTVISLSKEFAVLVQDSLHKGFSTETSAVEIPNVNKENSTKDVILNIIFELNG